MNFSKETINFIKSLFNPLFFIHTLFHWIKVLSWFFLIRVDHLFRTNVHPICYYPSYLKRIIKKEISHTYAEGYLRNLEVIPSIRNYSKFKEFTPPKIVLSNIEISINDVPDWLQTFNDKQDVFSLHRWGWLLMVAVDAPSAEIKRWGIRVMKDWCLKMKHNKRHPGWESYSISERIVNGLLFFYVLRNYPCDMEKDIDFLEKEFIYLALYLKEHLEFHGEFTNNHVLNNARALYLLGIFSSHKALANIGRQIFLKETQKMISPSGFLREESSYYHLLLLRTYLEILRVANINGDSSFENKIRSVAISVIKAAWIFNIYNVDENDWDFPLIGDVSPDFPIKWLVNICRSKQALELYSPNECEIYSHSGWNKIWSLNTSVNNMEEYNMVDKDYFQHFDDSGWYRLDYYDFVILWHINRSGCIPSYSHGHNDILSFVLYWKGCPVIIDPGRFSYEFEPFALYGKESKAHNTFIIDGYEPYPLNRYRQPPGYGKGSPKVDWSKKDEGFVFRISHDGFSRVNKTLYAVREFFVTKNSLKINDFIYGSGYQHIKSYFHFGENIKFEDPYLNDLNEINFSVKGKPVNIKLIVKDQKSKIKILSGIRQPEPAGWFFPEYGSATPIETCIIKSDSVPHNAEYIFYFDKKRYAAS